MLAQQSYLRLDLEIFLRYLLVLFEDLTRKFARVVGRERSEVGIQKATNIAQVFARGAATCGIALKNLLQTDYPNIVSAATECVNKCDACPRIYNLVHDTLFRFISENCVVKNYSQHSSSENVFFSLNRFVSNKSPRHRHNLMNMY